MTFNHNKPKPDHVLQFATNMEKNKLFVRNLPFTCSKEALQQIFSQVQFLNTQKMAFNFLKTYMNISYTVYYSTKSQHNV